MNINTTTAAEHLTLLETWEGTRYPIQKRGKLWYIVAGTVAGGLALYGLIWGPWLLTVICALVVFLEWRLQHVEGRRQTMLIAQEGVVYDNDFVRWQDIEGCWAVRIQDMLDIHVLRRNPAGREMRIQVPFEKSEQKLLLVGRYTELLSGGKERAIDSIIRICKL